MSEKAWYVYIIQTEKGVLYTGITTDIERRFSEHLFESKKGAKFFRGSVPEKIVYQEVCDSRSMASKREAQIKKMKRSEKLRMCFGQA
jgi:putative endonuclease